MAPFPRASSRLKSFVPFVLPRVLDIAVILVACVFLSILLARVYQYPSSAAPPPVLPAKPGPYQLLLDRCQEEVSLRSHTREEVAAGSSSEGPSDDDNNQVLSGGGVPGNTVMNPGKVWDIERVRVTPLDADLGWVETWGRGLTSGKVNERSCFLMQVKSQNGTVFDKGCLQRAAFIGNLTVGPTGTETSGMKTGTIPLEDFVRLAADITYLPHLSMHSVCFTPPIPGVYQLKVRLMFTNAFLLLTSRHPANSAGYRDYVPVVDTKVTVVADGDGAFSLAQYRKAHLPACNLSLLSNSRNRGFWIGHQWYPSACRLQRISPQSLRQWLKGKSVLFIGDSEIRYAYGFLQFYLGLPSRREFWQFWTMHPTSKGSRLEVIYVPGGMGAKSQPLLAPGKGTALKNSYYLPTGWSTFLGSRYSGFGWQDVRVRGSNSKQNSVIKLTYVSFFYAGGELVDDWMRNKSLTNGMTPLEGRQPFDVVVESSLLHGVLKHDSVLDYHKNLVSEFSPRVKSVCHSDRCTFVSFGPLTGRDEVKPVWFLHKSNNVRSFAFEEEWYSTMRGEGLPNMLHMSSITVPVRGSELSADPTHYRAPVQLAMVDLLFGALCPVEICKGELL